MASELPSKSKKNIEMRPNRKRILEAILFVIDEAESAGRYVTQYDIVKTLFIADKWHMEKYGRPVTFDNYSAMWHGPVPEAAYDMLKPSYDGKRYLDSDWPLWDRVPSPSDGQRSFRYTNLARKPNLRALAVTDQAELREALKLVKSLRFSGTRDYTHKISAYESAWNSRGEKSSNRMSYEELFADFDTETLGDLAYASKHL